MPSPMMHPLINSSQQGIQKAVETQISNLLVDPNKGQVVKESKLSLVSVQGQYAGVATTTVRIDDMLEAMSIKQQLTNQAYCKVVTDGIQPIYDVINCKEEMQSYSLIQQMQDFFNSVNNLIGSQDSNVKSTFLNSAAKLTDSFNEVSSTIFSTMYNNQVSLSQSIDKLNDSLKQLYDLNRQLIQQDVSSDNLPALQDQREDLLNDITRLIDVDVTYSTNGIALLKSDATNLLSTSHYAQLNFEPVTSIEHLLSNNALSPIYITQIDSDNNQSEGKVFCAGSSQAEAGAINAHLHLNNTLYPSYLDALDTLATNIIYQVNKIHNQGAGHHGYTELQGTRLTKLDQQKAWVGTSTIAMVSNDGTPITNSDGSILNPLKLDYNKLAAMKGGKALTLRDIINEMNSYFFPAAGTKMQMGPEIDANGNTIPGKYLLDNVKLVINSLENDTLKFDFDLFNSSNFDAKVQVLDIQVAGDSTRSIGDLPNVLNLASGVSQRTFQSSEVNLNGLVGSQDVDIKIRVIGDNGVVRSGTVRFNINVADSLVVGTRVSGGKIIPADDFIQSATSYDRYLKVDLVSEEGKEILDTQSGYLKFTSTDSDYHFIIQDDNNQNVNSSGPSSLSKGFNHYFGMNNLFLESTDDKVAYNFALRPDILQHSEMLTTGTLIPCATKLREYQVGTVAASRSINFVPGLPADYNNATITVDNITYTLTNGPSTGGQIDISSAADETEIIDLIINTLSKNPTLNTILNFKRDGSMLTLLAITAGSSGNSIALRCTSTVPLFDHGSGPMSDTMLIHLTNGTDSKKSYSKPDLGLQVASHNTDLITRLRHLNDEGFQLVGSNKLPNNPLLSIAFGKLTSLTDFAGSILKNMGSIHNKVHNKLKRITSILEVNTRKYYDKFGPNQSVTLNNVMELNALNAHLSRASQILRRMILDNIESTK